MGVNPANMTIITIATMPCTAPTIIPPKRAINDNWGLLRDAPSNSLIKVPTTRVSKNNKAKEAAILDVG